MQEMTSKSREIYLKRLNGLSTFTPEFQPRMEAAGEKLFGHRQIEIEIHVYERAGIVVGQRRHGSGASQGTLGGIIHRDISAGRLHANIFYGAVAIDSES